MPWNTYRASLAPLIGMRWFSKMRMENAAFISACWRLCAHLNGGHSCITACLWDFFFFKKKMLHARTTGVILTTIRELIHSVNPVWVWEGHILTPCCFQWPSDLWRRPRGVHADRSLESLKQVPRDRDSSPPPPPPAARSLSLRGRGIAALFSPLCRLWRQ